jgi:hypothetical protein
VAKRPRDPESVGNDLDVIDLVTDERVSTGHRPEPEAGRDRRPRRRRRLVLAIAAVVAVIVGVSVVESRDDGETEGVGIASEEPDARGGLGNRDTSDTPPGTAPDVVPAAWRALGARFAVGYERDLLIVDGASGNIRHPRTLPDASVRVVHGHGGAVFVVAGEERLLLDDDGRITDVEGTRAFPGVEADLWWSSRAERVATILGDAPAALMPENTYAFAAVRGGFVVRDDRSGAVFLIVDGALRLITDQSPFSVVAIHPDRIAWHGGCPGDACVLHVTEVATGHDVVIPGPVPMLEPNRAMHGRFSPDAHYLALQRTAVQGERADFVLVDLTSGATLTRLEIDEPMPVGVSTGVTAVPFDFTPDNQRVIVADWTSGGRLVVLRTADGAQEQIVERAGPVSSLAALDAQPYEPTTPLLPDHPPPSARTGEPSTTTTYTFGGPFESDFIVGSSTPSCLATGTYEARTIPISTTAKAVGHANITYQVCVEQIPPPSSSGPLSGTFLLTTNDGTATGTFVGSTEDPVVGASVHYDMTITNGTGRFAGATGSGTLDSSLVALPFHFTGTVAGAFDVPG